MTKRDAERFAADLRVELYAINAEDARATLDEICSRLFGEECVVTIVVPDSSGIMEVRGA